MDRPILASKTHTKRFKFSKSKNVATYDDQISEIRYDGAPEKCLKFIFKLFTYI